VRSLALAVLSGDDHVALYLPRDGRRDGQPVTDESTVQRAAHVAHERHQGFAQVCLPCGAKILLEPRYTNFRAVCRSVLVIILMVLLRQYHQNTVVRSNIVESTPKNRRLLASGIIPGLGIAIARDSNPVAVGLACYQARIEIVIIESCTFVPALVVASVSDDHGSLHLPSHGRQ
jgi:hypothetical protein